jgi:reactive chlorine resistance protein C
MSITTLKKTTDAKTLHYLAFATGSWADRVETAGRHSIRYGLVIVLLWIGGMKFNVYEAEGISGLYPTAR